MTHASDMSMDILQRPAESRMQRWTDPNDVLIVYAKRSDLEPLVTLSGAELLAIVALHFAQAHAVLTLAEKVEKDRMRDLYSQRRLVGQHKALRGR